MATVNPQYSPVSSNDRLGFALFLALAVHGVLVLGINFAREELPKLAPTLEITLAQHKSDKAPNKADYAAQFNQEGSGSAAEKKTLTTEKLSPFNDTLIRDIAPNQQVKAQTPQQQTQKNLLSTTGDSTRQAAFVREKAENQRKQRDGKDKTILQRREEIASMEARLDRLRQKDARRPRIHRLTSVATKSTLDAEYLRQWRDKMEMVGNLYYPEKSNEQQIFGSLQLLVSVLPNGNIHGIQVINSSGHKVLDDAAVNTVKKAAPFPPFPPELAAKVDRLEIIRTWHFDRHHKLTTE